MSATPPPNTALTPAQMRARMAILEVLMLVLLGFGLLYTNRMFTFIDDEVNILGPAAQPTSVFLKSLGTVIRGHEHPPLYDLLIHVWLRATGGAMDWLRVPSVLFFLAGLFCLSRAARLLGGFDAGTALLWLGVLWPYSFHFARLAAWYSFVFFLISALTWAYLRHSELVLGGQSPAVCRAAWIRVCLLGLALVYANYLGWALLFLLAVDDWLRHRAQPGTLKRLLFTAAIFIVAYAPLWPAFRYELSAGTTLHQSWTYRLANTAYNVYVLFVSESIGPWFWQLGVPAAIAAAACVLLVFFNLRGPARRFLLFGMILIVSMALAGILYPRRLFVVAPWFLLPIATAIGVVQNRYWRSGIALCLGMVAAVGWFGVSNRRYYAAPRFFEPWEAVAQGAAQTVRNGGLVVGNNPSFLFYLTYALQVPESSSGWQFSGVLTEGVTHPQVWDPGDWEAAGRPLRPAVLWVRGMPGPEQGTAIAAAGEWLDQRCPGGTFHYFDRDPSYQAKQKFAPGIDQLLWRVETHEYTCDLTSPPPATSGNPTSPAPH